MAVSLRRRAGIRRLIRSGLLLDSFTSAPPDSTATPHPFSDVELEAAWSRWSTHSPVLADALLVMAHTGLRWDEARAITVADASPNEFHVTNSCREGRHTERLEPGRIRRVPVSARVAPVVDGLTAGRDPDELLFTTSLGAPLQQTAVLTRLDWQTTAPGRRLDDLRHTAARLWRESGATRAQIAHWLGSSPRQTS